MARTLTEIYNEARKARDQYLQHTEAANTSNSSKMSIMDALTWVTSACICTFENILDVFKVDVAKDLQNRINGTSVYYANALLKYQSGDSLVVSNDGGSFSYSNIDESKRIIKKVAFYSSKDTNFNDTQTIFKVATGEAPNYSKISNEELKLIQAYLDQIAFAGQKLEVKSRQGDVLIPRIKVYYTGFITQEALMEKVIAALKEYIAKLDFDSKVYVQKLVDVVTHIDNVVDVQYTSSSSSNALGVYYRQYNDDDVLSEERRIDRFFIPNSGYVRESNKGGEEKNVPTWKECITLVREGENEVQN